MKDSSMALPSRGKGARTHPLHLGPLWLYGLMVFPAAHSRGELFMLADDYNLELAMASMSLFLAGLVLMLLAVVRSRGRRAAPTWLLLAGIAQVSIHGLVFRSVDRFTIFETSYMVALVFVLPVLAGCAPWLIPALRERLPPSGILGFTLWSVAAGIAHLGLTAAASASV